MISVRNNWLSRQALGSWLRVRQEYKVLWKNYLYQSFLAVIVVSVIFWILSVEQAVIIASIGSTAFIVFSMPSYPTAKARRVIGGHLTGFCCGILGAWILGLLAISPVLVYSFIVGLSIFLMVSLDFEHPPASGTALGVAISGFSVKILLAVLTSAIVLALAHHYLKKYLRDLI